MRTDTRRDERSDKTTRQQRVQYSVSTPTEYEKDGKTETFWTTIGRAFETEKGILVKLNALPISGTMFLQLPKEKDS